MRLLILTASIWVLTYAKPEMYKEKEDFQFSRSSSDDGVKAGFYGAQRGNMGGNYERAHNMDSLAQHQMSSLVRQVDGELGEGANTRTGSVFTSGNSRGIYGSGNYDLGNLKGRNFAEGVSYDDLHSSSQMAQNLGFQENAYSASNNARYVSSHAQSSRHNSGYQAAGHQASDYAQAANQQALEGLMGSNNYEYGSHGGSNNRYISRLGSQVRSDYDVSNTNLNSERAFDSNANSRLITTPVKVYLRPGYRVAVPIAAQTYDASQIAASSDTNSINSDAEVLSTSGQRVNYRPSNAKHYESSYSYRKEWEKHNTQPLAVTIAPTENPFPINSELYEDTQQNQNAGQEYEVDVNNAQYSNVNNAYSSGFSANTKTASSNQSGYRSRSLGTGQSSSAYTIGAQSSDALANVNNLDVNSLTEDVHSKPKSYHSSYSYHKSWERRGDPYVIKPVESDNSAQTFQRLTAASANSAAFASHQHGSHYNHYGHSQADCDENGHLRVVRSYNMDDLQQQQDYSQYLNQQSENLEDLGQQTQNHWDNLEDLGQQTQNKWDNFESLTQQSQKPSGNLEDFGQQTQNHWDKLNLESLTQQSQKKLDNLEDLDIDLGQQTQSKLDNFEYLGQQTQNKLENFEYLGQQTQSDKLEDFSQQAQDKYENLDNFGQQTQSQWNQQTQTFDNQQTQATWNNFQDISQQKRNMDEDTQSGMFDEQKQNSDNLYQQNLGLKENFENAQFHQTIQKHQHMNIWDKIVGFDYTHQANQDDFHNSFMPYNNGQRVFENQYHQTPWNMIDKEMNFGSSFNKKEEWHEATDEDRQFWENLFKETHDNSFSHNGYTFHSNTDRESKLIGQKENKDILEESLNNIFNFEDNKDTFHSTTDKVSLDKLYGNKIDTNTLNKKTEETSSDPKDIGRGDIGPEETITANIKPHLSVEKIKPESDNGKNTFYKTPEEIESLTLTQAVNDTSIDQNIINKKPIAVLSVLGVDQQKESFDLKESMGNSNNKGTSNQIYDHDIVQLEMTEKDFQTMNTQKEVEQIEQMPASIEQQNMAQDLEDFNQKSLQQEEQNLMNFEQQNEAYSQRKKINSNIQSLNTHKEVVQLEQMSTNIEQQNVAQDLEDFNQQSIQLDNQYLIDFGQQNEAQYPQSQFMQFESNSEKTFEKYFDNTQQQNGDEGKSIIDEPIKSQNVQNSQSIPKPIDNIPVPLEPPTEKPGFWKSVWHKTVKAKDTVSSWFKS